MISTEEQTMQNQSVDPLPEIERDEDKVKEDEDGWKTVPQRKTTSFETTKTVESTEGKNEATEGNEEVKSVKKVYTKKSPSERQLLDQFIRSIPDKNLRDGAFYLSKLIFNGSKSNAHTRYYQSVDLLDHLAQKSKSFVHQIVRHLDKKTSTKISLWSWTYKGNNIYIATTSAAPWYRFSDKRKSPLAKKHYEYNSVVNRFTVQSETDPEARVLSEEGFKELEKMALRDISVEFMKLHFFSDFASADAYVKLNTTDRILHMKKSRPEICIKTDSELL